MFIQAAHWYEHLYGTRAARVHLHDCDSPTLSPRRGVRIGGWVDLTEPIIVRAGEAFVVMPEPEPPAEQHSELFRFRAQPETEVDKPG